MQRQGKKNHMQRLKQPTHKASEVERDESLKTAAPTSQATTTGQEAQQTIVPEAVPQTAEALGEMISMPMSESMREIVAKMLNGEDKFDPAALKFMGPMQLDKLKRSKLTTLEQLKEKLEELETEEGELSTITKRVRAQFIDTLLKEQPWIMAVIGIPTIFLLLEILTRKLNLLKNVPDEMKGIYYLILGATIVLTAFIVPFKIKENDATANLETFQTASAEQGGLRMDRKLLKQEIQEITDQIELIQIVIQGQLRALLGDRIGGLELTNEPNPALTGALTDASQVDPSGGLELADGETDPEESS